jgi:hypothetical protein
LLYILPGNQQHAKSDKHIRDLPKKTNKRKTPNQWEINSFDEGKKEGERDL